MIDSLRWWPESVDVRETPSSGSRLRCLTSAPALTTNIYCEQPYCSTDGNRLALLRKTDPDPMAPGDLLVYDIARYKVARLARDVIGVANSAWSGILFANTIEDGKRRRWRFDLNTLEREELPVGEERGAWLHSVSLDQRFGLANSYLGNGEYGVLQVELESGECEIIHRARDLCNPHLQYSFGEVRHILVQENRGCIVDDIGNVILATDERGAGLYSLDAGGGNRRDFPVAAPHTPSTTGHEAWIGSSERVLVSLTEPWNDGERRGNLVEVETGLAKARVVFESEQMWTHVCVSRCGRFWVSDCYESAEVPLVVGSIATGKSCVLCEAKTSGGGAQYSHAHPYFSSDNRWVVFNSDRTGLAQVYIASIPEGLLESLDC